MDEQPVKIAKITIRVDCADGSAIEAQAREPRDLGVDFAYPEPEFDLLPRSAGAGASRDVTYVSLQPPPTVTVRFTVSGEHGWQERHITRAENEKHRSGEPDLPT